MAQTKMIRALCDAFDEEMARDENVCLFGEDVAEFGGVFGTSLKLQKRYGAQRVFDTPLSEGAIIGTAVGAALAGLRPIAEIMYLDFVVVGLDPLVNQAAKLRCMSGGQLKLPLVIFTQFGAGTAEAAQHSQSLEAWFAHTPGLKVVMPATVYDAKGLLKSAIRDDNPVLFIWHRLLYNLQEDLPAEEYLVPLGRGVIRKSGTDITLVATSLMVHKALAAAEQLAPKIDVEVIDPRTIAPLDIEMIVASVRKTGRLLVVHEAPARCGIGSEIIRQVVAEAFDALAAPPLVVGAAHVPMPFSPVLENAVIPQENDIRRAVEKLMTQEAEV